MSLFLLPRCGPCKYIGPIFVKMSEEFGEVVFAKIDVDAAEDVAARCGINAMPTFQFYRNGNKVAEMQGADEQGLRNLLSQHK